MSEAPKFCVCPRVDGSPGICGRSIGKRGCRHHTNKEQNECLKAYPAILKTVCTHEHYSPGICGKSKCEKHEFTKIKKTTKKRKHRSITQPLNIEPVTKKPRLDRQEAFSGVQSVIKDYESKIVEMEQKIEMYKKFIQDLTHA